MIATERKIYRKPQCNIICAEALLVTGSGNAGEIQPGTVTGDAKQNIFSSLPYHSKKHYPSLLR